MGFHRECDDDGPPWQFSTQLLSIQSSFLDQVHYYQLDSRPVTTYIFWLVISIQNYWFDIWKEFYPSVKYLGKQNRPNFYPNLQIFIDISYVELSNPCRERLAVCWQSCCAHCHSGLGCSPTSTVSPSSDWPAPHSRVTRTCQITPQLTHHSSPPGLGVFLKSATSQHTISYIALLLCYKPATAQLSSRSLTDESFCPA